ncbi:hypothetical protein [Mesonia aestuariivivens]|uniref:DUF721 domain-containing protein n=1 Tax=Mesonia aestuariivivens TaxID=2796128 RepID=A0ABS6W3G0_9FLAO|nr:hypothetical protein [Mesonia aestuariivivens]MBW2962385.1 hypothetical protein [Mesonia aestuariivivens]
MKVKEFYYEEKRIESLKNSLFDEVSAVKKTSDKLYCFILKKYFKAENVLIAYHQKIAYLQFSHSNHQITDERILIANTRIVEVHYSNLRKLLLSCLRKSDISFYNEVKGFRNKNKTILTSKN